MSNAGQDKTTCGSCGEVVRWAKAKKSGKWHPYNLDGESHFATCPDAARHRRRREKGDKRQMGLFG